LLIPILLIACERPKVDKYLQPLTLEAGVLTVVTRNIPTAYYYGSEGETGFEYDLVRTLANDLGLKLKLIVAGSVSEMLTIMAGNRADLAAGGLTRTPERERCFTFGPDYYPVRQQLVYRRGMPHPHNFEELQK
jgi:membrane-bound lytic murein transglycosylase F